MMMVMVGMVLVVVEMVTVVVLVRIILAVTVIGNNDVGDGSGWDIYDDDNGVKEMIMVLIIAMIMSLHQRNLPRTIGGMTHFLACLHYRK